MHNEEQSRKGQKMKRVVLGRGLIDENFAALLLLSTDGVRNAHRELAKRGVSGGAVYDGLVALAARERRRILVTRNARARSTYELSTSP